MCRGTARAYIGTESTFCVVSFIVIYLENEVHAVLCFIEHSSAHLPVLELYGDDTSFCVVQKDDRHSDAGIAGDGHWCTAAAAAAAAAVAKIKRERRHAEARGAQCCLLQNAKATSNEN